MADWEEGRPFWEQNFHNVYNSAPSQIRLRLLTVVRLDLGEGEARERE